MLPAARSLSQAWLAWAAAGTAPWPSQQRRAATATAAAAAAAAAAPSSTRLGDLLKLELLPPSPDEVESLWLQHHQTTTSHVGSALSAEECRAVAARAAASPLCVLPLRKPGGFLSLLINWQPQAGSSGGSSSGSSGGSSTPELQPLQALVTSLDAYKHAGSSAPPCLVVTLYRELASSHGLVLARGDVLAPQLVSAPEARTVVELLRAMYADAASYQQFVWAFNHAPARFDFGALLRELRIPDAP